MYNRNDDDNDLDTDVRNKDNSTIIWAFVAGEAKKGLTSRQREREREGKRYKKCLFYLFQFKCQLNSL